MISLDKKSNTPLYDQLYSKIRKMIIIGEYPVDMKLTAVRVLAEDLGISKNTVETAYKQLMAEGFIRAERGSGYYVEDVSEYFALTDGHNGTMIHNEIKNRNVIKYDFRYSSIESSNFPWKKWKHYLSEAIADMEYQDYVSYESNKGNRELRENIRKFLYDNRGVECSAEQIIICSGTQHAAEIVANLLGGSKISVAFEEPGFYTTRNIFEKSGCNVKPVNVTEQGIDIEELYGTKAKLVYVTPSRQMPMGYVMPVENRKKLLQWAEEKGTYIFEDDYDSEFRHGVMPVPSIQSMDRRGSVIYVGTFSKILLPSYRMAYMVLPHKLLKQYEKKYKYFNSFLPTSHQVATTKFMEDGSLERHMWRMIKLNHEKHEILTESLKKYMGDNVEFYGQPGGTHLLVKIRGAGDEEDVLNKLNQYGVKIYGTKDFWINKNKCVPNLFMIGFNSINSRVIEEGCRTISEALKIDPQ